MKKQSTWIVLIAFSILNIVAFQNCQVGGLKVAEEGALDQSSDGGGTGGGGGGGTTGGSTGTNSSDPTAPDYMDPDFPIVADGECPSSDNHQYVRIPNLATYVDNNVCVAKYEMKKYTKKWGNQTTVSITFPQSKPEGSPWVSLPGRDSANAECQKLGGGFRLINNDEWQALARDIANVDSNWSLGLKGMGKLNQGHSDSDPNGPLAASSKDDEACIGTNQQCTATTAGSDESRRQKRTHKLSNGSTIWDLGGNVVEYVLDDNNQNMGGDTYASMLASSDSRTASFGSNIICSAPSDSPYCGFGRLHTNSAAGAILRGGNYASGVDAGVFYAHLHYGTSVNTGWLGFRCVYDYSQDKEPNKFAFKDVFNASAGQVVVSNGVAMKGFSGQLDVTVTGSGNPLLSKDKISWGTTLQVSSGDTLYVQITAADAVGESREATVTVGQKVADTFSVGTAVSCPTNYVPVVPIAPYTSKYFCMAKYEMKIKGVSVGNQSGTISDNGVAESRNDGTPWVNLTQEQAQVKCKLLGTGYDLPTNAQWQTVARNVIKDNRNWGTYIYKKGYINQGHSDNNPAGALEAASDDNDSCLGTGNTCSLSIWHDQRRTHFLPNNQIIWDLSGNVDEWIADRSDGSVNGGTRVMSSTDLSESAKYNYGPDANSVCETNDGTSHYCGFGVGYLNATSGFQFRGSSYNSLPYNDWNGYNHYAGIFSVQFGKANTHKTTEIGFRCVYNP